MWPEQYGLNSLQVRPGGFDPVFDVIPAQTYKDFYLEVVCGHPALKHLNVFEVVDTALNQIRAPEASTLAEIAAERAAVAEARRAEQPRVAGVDLHPGSTYTDPGTGRDSQADTA